MAFVNIRLQDILSTAFESVVTFEALSTPIEDGTTLTVGTSAQVLTDSDGEALAQSIEGGNYNIYIAGHTWSTVAVPDDANTYELTALITTGTYTSSPGAWKLPHYTTAERDAFSSVAEGWMIYNTTTAQVEKYEGAAWIATSAGAGGAVTTVFARTGAVVAVSGDYDADEITETATNKIFLATERTKLTGIETSATADQTGAEIKTAYELEADTNEFSDAEQTKLAGIATGADVAPVDSVFSRTGAVVAATNDYTWAQVNKGTSDIADITTKSHTSLTDVGSNTHAQVDTHIASTANPHSVTATQVSLGNVDNTSNATERAAAATLTNKTIDEASNTITVSLVGVYRELYINAGAMIPRTTNGAATGTTELATNDIMLDSMDFDTTTEEGVGFWITLPTEWDASTVKFKAHWTAASGSGTVKWDFAATAYADSDAIDAALGTEQGSTDTLITANDMHISPATSALTIGGTPTAGEPIYVQVARDVGTDTLGVDAQLLGVVLQYKETTTEPSIF